MAIKQKQPDKKKISRSTATKMIKAYEKKGY